MGGIFLNTRPEFDAVYCRSSFENDKPQSKYQREQFDLFFEPVKKEAERRGEKALDPNDSERIVRLYEDLILEGNRDAIWRFYVFEQNLLEAPDSPDIISYTEIDEAQYPTALQVSFF